MALPSSGTITWEMIRAEFGGGQPIKISNYYRGGPYVENSSFNGGVPTSGKIQASHFYGTRAYVPIGIYGPTMVHRQRRGAGSLIANVAMSRANGESPFTYSWTYQSGAPTIYIDYPTITNPTFSTTFGGSNPVSRIAVWRFTVSDSRTSAFVDVTIHLEVIT